MFAEIGAFAAALALALSLAQGVIGLAAARRDSRAEATKAIAQVSAVLCLIAFVCLISAFVRSDFSVSAVANNSHTDKPLIYKIAGAWGNHEGSMLLWCCVSAVFGAVLASTRGGQSMTLWCGSEVPSGRERRLHSFNSASSLCFGNRPFQSRKITSSKEELVASS